MKRHIVIMWNMTHPFDLSILWPIHLLNYPYSDISIVWPINILTYPYSDLFILWPINIMTRSRYKLSLLLFQAKEKPGSKVQPDDPISFLELSSARGTEFSGTENVFELSLNQALIGSGSAASHTQSAEQNGSSKLNKVHRIPISRQNTQLNKLNYGVISTIPLIHGPVGFFFLTNNLKWA